MYYACRNVKRTTSHHPTLTLHLNSVQYILGNMLPHSTISNVITLMVLSLINNTLIIVLYESRGRKGGIVMLGLFCLTFTVAVQAI